MTVRNGTPRYIPKGNENRLSVHNVIVQCGKPHRHIIQSQKMEILKCSTDKMWHIHKMKYSAIKGKMKLIYILLSKYYSS